MKGIILAAGKGTRMYPMTLPVCKPLIPVYDKPLIYYPMAVLMQAGIRDILIIVPPDEMYSFIKLFGDGSELGLNLSYRIQKVQRGIADAFLIGESFIGNDSVCLILGDNIFYGEGLRASLRQAAENRSLLRSANTVMQIQQRTGTQVACLEEIAYRMGYITLEQLRARGLELKNTDYGAHILRTCESAGV